MNQDAVSIHIHIETDVTLSVNEVWPDGDAPDEVTAAAVSAVMEAGGTKSRVLRDWCLLDDVDVDVGVDLPNPHYGGDAALFGEVRSRWLHSSARPWNGS